MFVAVAGGRLRAGLGRAAPLLGALALVAAGVLWSWGPGALPASLALSALGLLLAAAVMVGSGAAVRAAPQAHAVFAAFCLAWVLAGAINTGLAKSRGSGLAFCPLPTALPNRNHPADVILT